MENSACRCTLTPWGRWTRQRMADDCQDYLRAFNSRSALLILRTSSHLQGAAPTPWGRWTRQWTAEENRHGDAMNKYMYLSGKVNLKVLWRSRMCMPLRLPAPAVMVMLMLCATVFD